MWRIGRAGPRTSAETLGHGGRRCRLTVPSWVVPTATERARAVNHAEGDLPLHDVVVRVERAA